MSCQPERVTGFVDGALDAEESVGIAAHLESCPDCRAQAEQERALRARFRALPGAEARPGFQDQVRRQLRRGRTRRLARVLLPLAAGLAGLALWLRGSPDAVALALAFDHAKCFRKEPLAAKVVSQDATAISAWFERQGTPMPVLPAQAAGLRLAGARYCPLLDGSLAAHVYYRDGPRHVSLFVIPRGLRMAAGLRTAALGRDVRLLAGADRTIGVVGDDAADVDAIYAPLLTRSAAAGFLPID